MFKLYNLYNSSDIAEIHNLANFSSRRWMHAWPCLQTGTPFLKELGLPIYASTLGLPGPPAPPFILLMTKRGRRQKPEEYGQMTLNVDRNSIKRAGHLAYYRPNRDVKVCRQYTSQLSSEGRVSFQRYVC